MARTVCIHIYVYTCKEYIYTMYTYKYNKEKITCVGRGRGGGGGGGGLGGGGGGGAGSTFPAGSKAEVVHPGRQAGEHLMVRCLAHCILLPIHHLHTQQLTQLRMIPAVLTQELTQLRMIPAELTQLMMIPAVLMSTPASEPFLRCKQCTEAGHLKAMRQCSPVFYLLMKLRVRNVFVTLN